MHVVFINCPHKEKLHSGVGASFWLQYEDLHLTAFCLWTHLLWLQRYSLQNLTLTLSQLFQNDKEETFLSSFYVALLHWYQSKIITLQNRKATCQYPDEHRCRYSFSLCFFSLFLREREHNLGNAIEKERHRIWRRLQALSCQHRAIYRAQTHEPWDHDLSWSQMLNQLNHPGAPKCINS